MSEISGIRNNVLGRSAPLERRDMVFRNRMVFALRQTPGTSCVTVLKYLNAFDQMGEGWKPVTAGKIALLQKAGFPPENLPRNMAYRQLEAYISLGGRGPELDPAYSSWVELQAKEGWRELNIADVKNFERVHLSLSKNLGSPPLDTLEKARKYVQYAAALKGEEIWRSIDVYAHLSSHTPEKNPIQLAGMAQKWKKALQKDPADLHIAHMKHYSQGFEPEDLPLLQSKNFPPDLAQYVTTKATGALVLLGLTQGIPLDLVTSILKCEGLKAEEKDQVLAYFAHLKIKTQSQEMLEEPSRPMFKKIIDELQKKMKQSKIDSLKEAVKELIQSDPFVPLIPDKKGWDNPADQLLLFLDQKGWTAERLTQLAQQENVHVPHMLQLFTQKGDEWLKAIQGKETQEAEAQRRFQGEQAAKTVKVEEARRCDVEAQKDKMRNNFMGVLTKICSGEAPITVNSIKMEAEKFKALFSPSNEELIKERNKYEALFTLYQDESKQGPRLLHIHRDILVYDLDFAGDILSTLHTYPTIEAANKRLAELVPQIAKAPVTQRPSTHAFTKFHFSFKGLTH